MEIKIELSQVGRVKEVVEAVRNHFLPGLQISLSTNTLERAYLEIEKRTSEADVPTVSTETVYQIMDQLYARQDNYGPSFFRALILIIKNKVKYLTQNTFEFVKVIGQYVFIILVISVVFTLLQKYNRPFDQQILGGMFSLFLTIELIISTFGVHNLVYENVRSIKHTLLVNRISPVCYYLAKLLGEIITTMLIYGIVLPAVYLASKSRLEQANTVQMFFRYVFQFCTWRLSYATGGLLFYRIFESPKLITVAYPAFYLLVASCIFLAKNIFGHEWIYSLNEFTRYLSETTNGEFKYGPFLIFNAVICLVYFWTTVMIEVFHLKYNYWNSSIHDSSLPVNQPSLDEPLINEGNSHLRGISMDNRADQNVAKEREETLQATGKKIRTVNLIKRYGRKVTALNGVTFNVPEAVNFGLVGPNGAGKSTLFNVILGKTPKTQGHLSVTGSGFFGSFGQFLFGSNPYNGNRFGVAFQTETIWDELTVAENLNFYAHLHNVNPEALSSLLVYFEFEHFLQKTAKELSSGNKRKLCILASLMTSPNIVLYDEATTGVDLAMRLKLKKLFEYLRERNRLTSIFTTHFLKDVEIFCEKIGIIADGDFLFVDFIENIKADFGGYMVDLRYKNPAILETIPPSLAHLCQLQLTERNDLEGKVTFKALQVKDVFSIFLFFYDLEQKGAIQEFAFHQMSIEDIYVGVFKNRAGV
jgi:ABC-type multidrug transport system ATPase subunit